MKNNKFRLAVLVLLAALMVGNSITILNLNAVRDRVDQQEAEIVALNTYPTPTAGVVNVTTGYFVEQMNVTVNTSEPVKEPEVTLPDEDIKLIALVTMGEAEGENEYGQRLVIDTILNRMDSVYFPDTAHDVIYQKNQFSCMWDGRIDRCYAMDTLCDLVKEELYSRSNYEVMFFTAGGYGKYGVPMFKEGNHYFCSYE